MQQAFAFLLLIQLLLNGREDAGIDPFDLTFRVPGHCILQGCPGVMDRFNCLGNHPPLLRQLMPQPGTDFRQGPLFVAKRQLMPTGGDAIIEMVKFPLQGSRSTAFEQFRMNGTPKQVQTKFSDLGADK